MVSSRFSHFSLVIHKEAQQDLDQLWDTDEEVAADIAVFLEEAKANQDILDRLTCNKFVQIEEPKFSVEVWAGQQSRKRNLWRLKLFALNGKSHQQRIIYAFHPLELRYYILAVVHREFNYDNDHPITRRLIKCYEDIDIPSY